MATSEFDDFIRRQQAKRQESAQLDVGRELDEWRKHLSTLYDTVEAYMSAYIREGAATIKYRPIELNEEFSGPYEVNQMSLTIEPSVIQFKPIGTMLIGSKGRVDVQGPQGEARLVLVNRKVSEARELIHIRVSVSGAPPAPPSITTQEPIEWAWKLATRPPNMRFIDLDEATFFNMILMVADAQS
ncbi:hypothetical protein [Rhizobium miluonense]|uniref:Uncharacterized protein n=1 Tax=Rhizobium miluonense TaxID=411945 RepID=A0ABU1SYJ4_9HYPH|nr:hypothetical protein [Rhizobium miluonense]MDR6904071.1 hypothetical protein [Rhizobium miluonense]